MNEVGVVFAAVLLFLCKGYFFFLPFSSILFIVLIKKKSKDRCLAHTGAQVINKDTNNLKHISKYFVVQGTIVNNQLGLTLIPLNHLPRNTHKIFKSVKRPGEGR